MLDYSSQKPIDLSDEILLSLLEVIDQCAESYVGLIADKELLLEEAVALEEIRRKGLQDTSPIAATYGDDAVHSSDSVVHFEVLKVFINSPAFWNDLIVLQSEVGKRCRMYCIPVACSLSPNTCLTTIILSCAE